MVFDLVLADTGSWSGETIGALDVTVLGVSGVEACDGEVCIIGFMGILFSKVSLVCGCVEDGKGCVQHLKSHLCNTSFLTMRSIIAIVVSTAHAEKPIKIKHLHKPSCIYISDASNIES